MSMIDKRYVVKLHLLVDIFCAARDAKKYHLKHCPICSEKRKSRCPNRFNVDSAVFDAYLKINEHLDL